MNLGWWLDEHMYRSMDNRKKASFWKDPWFKGSSLIVRFYRVFKLSNDRNTNMAKMRRLGYEVEGLGWR